MSSSLVPAILPLRQLAGRVYRRLFPAPRAIWQGDSAAYWEDRYRLGGNSGAGSYSRLARFKADVLNDFVRAHGIRSVIEFGSGDGAQLRLATYPNYLGVDVSPTAVQLCRAAFAADPTKRFLESRDYAGEDAELALSLDVLYHLIEDKVFEDYMMQLFDAARRYVIIYSSDRDQAGEGTHVRQRRFSQWIEANRRDFALDQHIPNIYPFDPLDPDNTSISDFYVYRRR